MRARHVYCPRASSKASVKPLTPVLAYPVPIGQPAEDRRGPGSARPHRPHRSGGFGSPSPMIHTSCHPRHEEHPSSTLVRTRSTRRRRNRLAIRHSVLPLNPNEPDHPRQPMPTPPAHHAREGWLGVALQQVPHVRLRPACPAPLWHRRPQLRHPSRQADSHGSRLPFSSQRARPTAVSLLGSPPPYATTARA